MSNKFTKMHASHAETDILTIHAANKVLTVLPALHAETNVFFSDTCLSC
jgi:hypothetical protein